MHGQSIQNLTVVEFVVVIVLASLTSVFTGDPVWSAAGQVDGRSWLLIAYLGVLGTAFAFFMQLRSARLSSSTRVGLILCTEPVFATIFAIAVAERVAGLHPGARRRADGRLGAGRPRGRGLRPGGGGAPPDGPDLGPGTDRARNLRPGSVGTPVRHFTVEWTP
nr:hypothetical protein GCM10020092_053400 [Actinoplanes digitatis]